MGGHRIFFWLESYNSAAKYVADLHVWGGGGVVLLSEPQGWGVNGDRCVFLPQRHAAYQVIMDSNLSEAAMWKKNQFM